MADVAGGDCLCCAADRRWRWPAAASLSSCAAGCCCCCRRPLDGCRGSGSDGGGRWQRLAAQSGRLWPLMEHE